METFGQVYLIAYLIDCIFSILATLIPAVEGVSNLISAIISLCAVVVLVLSFLGRLRPQRIFLTLSIFYMCLLGFAMLLGAMLAKDLGPKIVSQKITTLFLSEHFVWYPTFHWVLLIMWAIIALWGLYSRMASNRTTEQRVVRMPQKTWPRRPPEPLG
jgi:hypothetical protein